ncbi:MAG: hypothetical protein ACI9Y1_000596 [Lentisphaeria bacterium]|jgi:hypothetical protein
MWQIFIGKTTHNGDLKLVLGHGYGAIDQNQAKSWLELIDY